LQTRARDDVMATRRINARRGEAAVVAALLFIGALFVWQSLTLPMGSVGLPGPGFFPLVLGIALAAASVWLLFGLVRAPGEGETAEIGHRDLVLTYAALLLVPVFFEWVGALLTLGVFAAAVAMIIGRVVWWRAGIGAVIGMAAAWYFFKVLLGVQLPAGML